MSSWNKIKNNEKVKKDTKGVMITLAMGIATLIITIIGTFDSDK